ncbi:MAG: hypothetical protein MZU91_14620 [Desulfosudis oleivorans]|nr:hypothetical protein [Desulfosudis oleivorans]
MVDLHHLSGRGDLDRRRRQRRGDGRKPPAYARSAAGPRASGRKDGAGRRRRAGGACRRSSAGRARGPGRPGGKGNAPSAETSPGSTTRSSRKRIEALQDRGGTSRGASRFTRRPKLIWHHGLPGNFIARIRRGLGRGEDPEPRSRDPGHRGPAGGDRRLRPRHAMSASSRNSSCDRRLQSPDFALRAAAAGGDDPGRPARARSRATTAAGSAASRRLPTRSASRKPSRAPKCMCSTGTS